MGPIFRFFKDLTLWMLIFAVIYIIAGIQTLIIVIALGLWFKYAEKVAKDAEDVQRELKR